MGEFEILVTECFAVTKLVVNNALKLGNRMCGSSWWIDIGSILLYVTVVISEISFDTLL